MLTVTWIRSVIASLTFTHMKTDALTFPKPWDSNLCPIFLIELKS